MGSNNQKEIMFTDALRQQFRNPKAYLEQLTNIIFGLVRFLVFTIAMTVAYAAATVLVVLFTLDLSGYAQQDLRDALRLVVLISGLISIFVSIYFNYGKFRDVFSDRAMQEITRLRKSRP